MKRHLGLLAAPVAAAAVFVATAGSALAAQTFSGVVANGGCGAVHPVTLNGASRLEATVATNGPNGEQVVTQVLAPGGQVVSNTAAYDAPAAGVYGVRVCYQPDGYGEPMLRYTGTIATGPLGEPLLFGIW